MYVKKRSNKINEVRTAIFMQKYKPKREDDKISRGKKLDGSMLLPCSRILWEKTRRTYCIAQLWMTSISPFPIELEPTDYGLQLEDNCYRIQWYKGESSPRALEIICEGNQEKRYQDSSESAEHDNYKAITQKHGIENSDKEGGENNEEDYENESGDNWEDSDCESD